MKKIYQNNDEIFRADVVCVVYAVDDDDTLDSVTEHWLPLLRFKFLDRNINFLIFIFFADQMGGK